MRKPLKKSIGALVLISQIACSAMPKYYSGSMAASAPSVRQSHQFEGMQEIDPESPPHDGLWMDWDNALAFSNALRNERVANEIEASNLRKDRAIAEYKAEAAQRQLAEDNSPVKKWWLTWGFPIGLGIGTILGIVVPVTIYGVQNAK